MFQKNSSVDDVVSNIALLQQAFIPRATNALEPPQAAVIQRATR